MQAEIPVTVHFPGMPYAPSYAALMFHANGEGDKPGCAQCAHALATGNASCHDFCEAGHQTVHAVQSTMEQTARDAWWN